MNKKRRMLHRALPISGLIGALLVTTSAIPAFACSISEAEKKEADVTSALLSNDSQDLATLKKLNELGAHLEAISASHDAAIESNDQSALDKACKEYDELSQQISALAG